jgi:hypothetical protein
MKDKELLPARNLSTTNATHLYQLDEKNQTDRRNKSRKGAKLEY